MKNEIDQSVLVKSSVNGIDKEINYTYNNGDSKTTYKINGKEVTKEEFDSFNTKEKMHKIESKCNCDNCTCEVEEDKIEEKTREYYNIYEIIELLKQMPKDTEAEMYLYIDSLSEIPFRVKLEKSEETNKYNLVYRMNDGSWSRMMQNVSIMFDDECILFAKFKLIEQPKEKWVDIEVDNIYKLISFITKIFYENGKVRWIHPLDEEIFVEYNDLEDFIDNIHYYAIKDYKWQYLKK